MPCPGTPPCCVYELELCCLSPSGTFPDICLGDGTPIPAELIDSSILAASQLLYVLTGRQFSLCQKVVRPCRQKCSTECCLPEGFGYDYGYGGYPFTPVHLASGDWTNISCDCNDGCSCTNLCEVSLPYPICSIDEVKIDGVVVDPTTYRVDDFKKLVRLGDECWPDCNDLTKPDSEVGTWSVKLTYGRPPPELVLQAAAVFACERIKLCLGKTCAFPQRVSSISRQGFSATFLDPMQFLDQGLTGIYLVDLAARTYNPRRLQRRPAVVSPDSLNKWRVTTWKPGDPIGPGCP